MLRAVSSVERPRPVAGELHFRFIREPLLIEREDVKT